MNAHSPIVAASEPTRLAVPKKQWGAALGALQRLLRDKDATEEVFEIMRALNGDSTRKGYHRLLATAEGGRLAYNREELAQKLSDRAWLATLHHFATACSDGACVLPPCHLCVTVRAHIAFLAALACFDVPRACYNALACCM